MNGFITSLDWGKRQVFDGFPQDARDILFNYFVANNFANGTPANVTSFLQSIITNNVTNYFPSEINLTEMTPEREESINSLVNYVVQNNFSTQSVSFSTQVMNQIINTPNNPLNSNVIIVTPSSGTVITDIKDYLKCFSTTQTAVVTLYVDQPTANSNTPWSGNPVNPNVGHTFFSIKQGNIRRVIGFYPSVGVSLNNPATVGAFHDDSNHEFDVTLSLNVTTTQLSNIINFIEISAASVYNLNSNNCTDFGMNIAGLAGIAIPSAYGTWGAPGIGSGAGDNPGQLGENVRNMPIPSNVVRTTSGGNAQSNMGTCP